MTNPINTSSTLPPRVGEGAPVRSSNTEVSTSTRQILAGSGNTPAPVEVELPEQRSAQEIAQATQNLSDYIQSVSRSLQISVDGDLGTTVIRVLDTETEELVRQIPAEEILQIARFLEQQQASSDADSSVRGILLDQEG